MSIAERIDTTISEKTMQSRIALVEQSSNHINESLNRIEKRFEMIDKKCERIESKLDNSFKWLITILVSIFLGIYQIFKTNF